MRVVLTPMGLDLSFRLRAELARTHKRQSSITPNPKSSQQKSETNSHELRSSSVHPTRPSTGTSPRKLTRSPQKLVKIQNKFNLLLRDREEIMRRVKIRAEKAREESQRAVISFVQLDMTLPSPSQDRAVYLRNLREVQTQKYSRVWGWLSSKGFAGTRRSVSTRPAGPS